MAELIPKSDALPTVYNDRQNNFPSDITIPRDMLNIGERIGAISIEPITTDALSMSNPNVAMRTENTTSKKKSKFGVLS